MTAVNLVNQVVRFEVDPEPDERRASNEAEMMEQAVEA
jgi:hypothetical protein